MQRSFFKKTLLATLLSTALVFAVPVTAVEQRGQTDTVVQPQSAAFRQVSFDTLGIQPTDPRFNHNFPLSFVGQIGYVPLTELLIQPKARNPFTTEQAVFGYFVAQNWQPAKSDLAFLAKVTGTKSIASMDADIESDVAKLAYLAAHKQALLGEFYATLLLDDWVQREPKAGRERINSPLNKAREYFEAQNKSRQASDKQSSDALNGIYRTALQLLPIDLQSELIVQFYLKSILYQEFETQQVTETLLSNYHSPAEIGQIAAAADVVVASMRDGKFAVQVNTAFKPEMQRDLGAVNTNFVGDYVRNYSDDDQLEQQFEMAKFMQIEQDKEKINTFFVTISNNGDNEQVKFVGKLNKNGRGIDFYNINGNEIRLYMVFNDDDLIAYEMNNNQPYLSYHHGAIEKKEVDNAGTNNVQVGFEHFKPSIVIRYMADVVGKDLKSIVLDPDYTVDEYIPGMDKEFAQFNNYIYDNYLSDSYEPILPKSISFDHGSACVEDEKNAAYLYRKITIDGDLAIKIPVISTDITPSMRGEQYSITANFPSKTEQMCFSVLFNGSGEQLENITKLLKKIVN